MLSTFMALSSCTPAHVGAAFAGVDAIILSPSREDYADLYVKRALLGGGPPRVRCTALLATHLFKKLIAFKLCREHRPAVTAGD